MGTRERKQREFIAREKLFLDTARELIREEGLLTLQMARLAAACDYATGTLYQHFNSKEDLLVALAADRSRAYSGQFCRAAEWAAPSRDRMFAVGVVDHFFGERHPNYTRLMQYVFTEVVWTNASPQRQEELITVSQPCIDAVSRIVAEGIEAGDLDTGPLAPMELAVGPWALCHGMQSLSHITGLLENLDIHDEPGPLLFYQMQAHLNGLGWRPYFDLGDRSKLDALVRLIQKEVITDEVTTSRNDGVI